MPNDEVQWRDGGRSFTWLSERDGWRHLYLVSRDGTKVDLRTPGNFDVVSIERIDEKTGQVYFIASPENVTSALSHRAALTGPAKIERLTPAGSPGSNDYRIAPGARWAFHTVSRSDARASDRRGQPAGGTARPAVMVRNEAMRASSRRRLHSAAEFFKVDVGGGTQLDAWMIKPPSFDPAKKYPLLVYVYSEPAGQTVSDRWGGDRYLWHLMLAQQGYLVASIDSQGAAQPARRATGARASIARSACSPRPTRRRRSRR